jgi:NADH-quinone oxidoreductase subunit L
MSALLFSPNLFQFYVFWELISAVSYLLIGFEYKNKNKSLASKRVFIINRVGDTALISGIILVSYFMYSFAENYSFSALMFEDFNSISTMLLAYTSAPVYCVICSLFILAAAVKSAQFPFYSWLQDAMEAKLPVSALLHSATMVAAGVYLIIKMMPFFTLNPVMTTVIIYVGLITAVICSILASVETQHKKVLAYSTSANLGLMFLALGFANIKTAVIFLVVHGLVKSSLFILLPAEKNMPKINFILFVISALTLSGLIFSGVGIKELLYKNILYTNFLPYIYMFICFVSAFYIIRLAALIYKNSEQAGEKNLNEITAFFILLSGNILLYILLRGSYHIAEPYAAGVGGVAFALLLCKHNGLEKFNKTPKITETILNAIFPAIYMKLSQGLVFIENNLFSNYKPILFMSKLPVKIADFIEEKIMNKSVNMVRDISKLFSKYDKCLQTGNVQRYNAYAFIFVTIVITLIITGYTLLLR